MRKSVKFGLLSVALMLCIALGVKGYVLQVASGTWAAQPGLTQARSGASAVLLQDGRILVTGGDGAAGTLASAELIGTDGTSSAAEPMSMARSRHVSALLANGAVLAAGGTTIGGGAINTAEIYDPVSNSWTTLAGGMVEARSNATATMLLDGRVLIAGGDRSGVASSTIEIFDPVALTFSFAGALASPRTDHAMARLSDGRVFIAGGSNGSAALNTTDIYDPVMGSVNAGPALSALRMGHSATTLLDGRVLIAGGNNGTADLASAEIFDPVAGTITVASSLTTARQGHLAFLLPNNNTVLIVGGTSAGVPLASAEAFTPWLGTFAPTGSLTAARSNSAGSPMKQDGLLLVAGGQDASGVALGNTDLYGFATVKTDQTDYSPGQIVTITGSGWQPGETVTLTLVESPFFDTHGPFTTIADSNGSISNGTFVVDSHDIGIHFSLTAAGAVSQAQTMFSDGNAGNGDGTMTVSPSSVIVSSTGNSFVFTFSTANGKDFNLGSQATILVPAGWTAPTSSNVVVAKNSCTAASLSTITGTGPWTVPINMTCAGGSSFTATYSPVTAPSTTGGNTFTTQTKQNGGTLTTIGTSPVVTVNNPVPTTTSISPSTKNAGDAAFTLTVNGTNFVPSSVVNFNGNSRTTTFVNSTQLTASIAPADVATGGTFNITVTNPTPGGGTSNAQILTVNNLVPTTTSIAPASKNVGDAAFTLTVNGTNFVSTSVVNFNGSARTTTFGSATQLTAAILATDLTTGGAFNITVTNPTPGGGTSNAQTLTVNNNGPTTTSISPASATLGGAGFTLTVNGTNFVSNSVVNFAGSPRTTTFVSNIKVTATIPASDLTTAGTFNITVTNPAPGGGTSNAQVFTVNNPLPTTTTISPASKNVGDGTFTLTVNGTNFVSGAVVNFSGSPRTTSFVSATQVTASIPATDLTTAGTFNITVTNPTPGGGTSNAQTLTVNNLVPTTTSIAPASKNVGDAAFTLTVNGTNFVSASVVNFNGSARTTTFVSATQLTASITAADVAAAGTPSITVTNPAPGGGTSNAQTLTVSNPAPTTTSISPATKNSGDAAFTLTVNGTNFVSGSVVNFNGAARTTTFVSGTQVTAAITTADVANAGTFNVTVVNGAPGGGTSNPQTLTVNPKLAITTNAFAILTGTCSSQITVQTQNGSGSAANQTVARSLTLSSNSTGGKFFSDAGCTAPVSSVAIGVGSSTANFSYSDTSIGTPVITVASTGLTSATQTEVETGLRFSNTALSVQVGQCSSALTLQSANTQGGMPTSLTQATTISLSSSSGGTFYSNAACTTQITTTSIGPAIDNGHDSPNFFYKDTTAGSPVVTASAGTASVTQTESVTKNTPVFTVPASQSITFGTTSITLSGTLAAGTLFPPSTESVSITINSVPTTATIGANGAFSATVNTSAIPASTTAYVITYSYAGDANFNVATNNATTLTVTKASSTTAVASSANPSNVGQLVTFSATVTASGGASGIPTGTVTFLDGTTTLGTGTLNASGVATFNTSSLAAGSHSITAAYGGDTNFASSTSTAVSQTVNNPATTTAVISSPSSSTFGQSVTFTATVGSVSGTPTGSVTFYDGGTCALPGTLLSGPTALVNGQAGFSTSALSAGSHPIVACYAPTGVYLASFGSVTQVVSQAQATVSFGTLTFIYDGTPKPVTVSTTPLGLNVAVTYAGSPTAPTNANAYPVVATIMDPNYAGTATGTLTITQAQPTVTWANPADISFGTALSPTQLNATASVPGSFTYTPGSGTVLQAGAGQTLSVDFTPNDAVDYASVLGTKVQINVTAASLYVVSSDGSRAFGQTNPTFTPTFVGLTDGDTSTTVGTVTCQSAAGATSTPGTYAATCTGVSSQNYTVHYVAGTLSVSNPLSKITQIVGASTNSETLPVGASDVLTATGQFANASTRALSVAGGTSFGKTALTTPVFGAAIAEAGGVLYALGGSDGTNTFGTIQAYDPATGIWTVLPNNIALATPRTNAAVASAAGKIYVIGGEDASNNVLSSVEVLDTTGANPAVTAFAGSLSVARSAAGAAVFNQKLYVIGGSNSASPALSSVDIFDLVTGNPTPGSADAGATLSQASAAVLTQNNISKLYVASVSGSSIVLISFDGTNWSSGVSTSLDPTQGVGVTSFGGLLYLVNGASMWSYDGTAFVQKNSLGNAHNGTQPVSIGSLIYAASVRSGSASSNLDAFAPDEVKWSSGDATKATVDQSGNITALAITSPGTVVITAASLSDPTITAQFQLTIIKKTQTIQFGALTAKTYGDADFGISATSVDSTSQPTGLLVGFTAGSTDGCTVGTSTLAGGVSNATVHITGAGSCTITASQPGDDTTWQAATSVPQTFAIAKATLTVTAANATRYYGVNNPTFTGTITGIQNGDNITATYASAATATSPVGTYPIVPTLVDPNGKLGNYTVTSTNGTLTVKAVAITVTAYAQTKVYGDSDPALTYKVTTGALVTGDSFTGALSRAIGESVGSYAINQGTLALSSNYVLTFVSANLTITARPITVTADPETKVFGSADPSPLTYKVTGTLVNGDTFSGALVRAAGSDVGTYPITQGSLALSTNYALTFVGANFAITQATPFVSATGGTFPYNGNAETGTGAAIGVLGEALPVTLTYFDASNTALPSAPVNAGNYTVVAVYGGSLNYKATLSTPAAIVITAIPLFIEANYKTRAANAADPTFDATYVGLINGETSQSPSLSGTLTCSSSASPNSPGGRYVINCSGVTSADYNITYVPGVLVITNPITTITVNPPTPSVAVFGSQPFTATGTFADGTSRSLTSGGGAWSSVQGMTTPVSGAAVGLINGVIYVAGGSNGGAATDSTEAYDITNNTWTAKHAMIAPRSSSFSSNGAVINGKLYVVGGSASGSCSSANEVYDPTGDAWTSLAGMSTARCDLAVVAANGHLYAIGGTDGGGTQYATVESYDPATNAWTTKASLPVGLTALSASVVSGKIYVIGGMGASGYTNANEVYDPSSDSWTGKSGMPTARSGLATGAVDGVIYAMGGQDSSGPLATVEAYNPLSDSWTTKAVVPQPIEAMGVVPANDVLYVAGGMASGTAVVLLQTYTPDDIVWTSGTTSVSTIDTTGNATALLPGSSTITASSLTVPTVQGSAPLTVIQATPVFSGLSSPTIVYGTASTTLSGKLALGAHIPTGSVSITVNTVNGVSQSAAIASADGSFTATFATNSFGVSSSPYAITYSYAGDTLFASVTDTTKTLTVTPANLTATADPQTKVYGSADPALTYKITSGTLINGDTLTGALVRASGETVAGSPYAISQGTLLANSNYTIHFTSSLFTITPKTASVTPAAASKTYGTTDPAFTGTLNGFLTADNVTATYARTTGETVAGSPYTISATLAPAAVLGNYNITYNTAAFTINKANASVTPAAALKTYGTSDPIFTGTLAGFIASDGVTATYARTAGETVAGSPYAISATLAPATVLGNYNITYNTAAFTINKATASVTPAAASKTYGKSDPIFTGTLAGFIASDGVTATYARTAGETVAGNPYAISATLAPATVLGNYNITYNTASFTITPASLFITASSGSMIYGGPVLPITPSYSGFVNGDSFANLSPQPSCGSTATSLSPVGAYVSACSGAADGNYTITYMNGVLAVMQATTTTAVVSSSPNNTSTYMQLVTFTATVVPQYAGTTPTGTVTFYNNGSSIGMGTLSSTSCGAPPCADQATFSISNLPDSGPDNITAVYGGDGNFVTSTSSAIIQTVLPAPNVSLSPMSVSFGNQNVNTSSSAANVTLSNIGDATLNINAGGISISPSTDFAQTNTCGATVAAGKSCMISITFSPVDTGIRTAVLQITDNDDDATNAQQTVALTGSGLSTIPGTSLFTDALFATANGCGSIVMSGGSTVDSFNSTQGYASSHAQSGGNVGTNGNVTLNGSKSAIYGSVAASSSSTGNCSKSSVTGVTTSGGAQVTGGVSALNGSISYPNPPAPNPAPPNTTQNISGSCGSLSGCSNTGTKMVSLIPGQYGNLNISGGTTAHFSKGIYNINSLTLSGQSILYVDSGPIVINLAGASLSGGNAAMDANGGSIENPTLSPENLQITYAGSRGLNLTGGATSYATVYAPNALVNMSGGTDFFGSIIASTVTNSGGTAIHYDSSLPGIASNSYIWFDAVANNVQGLPSNGAQVKLYLTNSSISFTANGKAYVVPVPNAVVTFNSSTALGTTFGTTTNRWSTSVPKSSLTGNTFVTGVAFQLPNNFPAGIQNVAWSASYSTDTPGITLQWQWGAAVYSNFSTTYSTTTNANVLGVNAEDGAPGPDPAGSPENYKASVVFGATGGGGTNYTGYFSAAAGVVPTVAPMSVSPSSLDFGALTQGSTSVPMTVTLSNNDSGAHIISSITPTGSNASDFAVTNTCPMKPNGLAAGSSCTITVIFTPGDVGTRTAKVAVNDDANNSPQTVYLSGTGL